MSSVFPRKKKKLLVEFNDASGVRQTAFTRDLSFTGFFVVAEKMPTVGELLTLQLHLPRGNVLVLTGKVARQGRASTAVATSAALGFGFALSTYSEDYTQLVASL